MNMWFGVVENRSDANASDGLKLGRVKVRIFGYHSADKIEDNFNGEGIPTADLFWAYPMMPINSASMNGIGESPTGMVEGTNVVGFSRDGDAMQDLVIIGTYGGTPKASESSKGFNDPNGVYPRSDFVGESDTNRLARNDSQAHSTVSKKSSELTTGVPIAGSCGSDTWSQPSNPYDARYPYNHVRETESGHIVEFDDTPGAERIHQQHRSGTFNEIDTDGNKVEKIVKDNYQIVLGDNNIKVSGRCNVYVDGDSNISINGNSNIDVKGDINYMVEGNVEWNVNGTYTVNTNNDYTVNVPKVLFAVQGNVNWNVEGMYNVNVDNNYKIIANRIDLN